jgi:hypothetical protein
MGDPVGSLGWLSRTHGRLGFADRFALVLGAAGGLRAGFRLRRQVRRSGHTVSLASLEPPETPMVRAAREYLLAHAQPSMVNHSFRTGFWALTVLHARGELSAPVIETAWVAALLHDVGLDVPPRQGDFSQGGVEVLESLAREVGWSQELTRLAGEAIATNLSTHVDRARLGPVAWAMNVGGVGELGFGPHRGLMAPTVISELETRYPREGFRDTALRLIDAEVARVPHGRFAFFRPAFRLLLR